MRKDNRSIPVLRTGIGRRGAESFHLPHIRCTLGRGALWGGDDLSGMKPCIHRDRLVLQFPRKHFDFRWDGELPDITKPGTICNGWETFLLSL